MSSSTPHNPSSTPAQFRSKLGTYLTGVAIGFFLLGSIYFFKHLATQRDQKAQQGQAQTQQETGVDPTGAQP